MDILLKTEGVKLDEIYAHGGFFKTEGVGQRILAAALNTPVSVMKTAGEGGAWGIALLAAYCMNKTKEESLASYLENKVFAGFTCSRMQPDEEDVKGFSAYSERFLRALSVEETAVRTIKI